jgi:endonuclease/exonuclease/phosphatase family metal-dependent hydrolase
MLLLSWNVAGRVGPRQREQFRALNGRDWDVLCLQEVTPTNVAGWREFLEGAGLHVAISRWPEQPRGSRRFAVLIAAPAPLEPLPELDLPWPERHLAARTTLDGTTVEIHTLHSPLSQKPGQVKVRTLETVFGALTQSSDVPRVIAGDFNTPRYESREGEVFTFARTRAGLLRPDYGERHDRAELALVAGLPERGWRDAFRSLHGYSRRDRSWMAPPGYGWRLDHVIASAELEPLACDYVHDWREQGLSDHSAIWAELRPVPL